MLPEAAGRRGSIFKPEVARSQPTDRKPANNFYLLFFFGEKLTFQGIRLTSKRGRSQLLFISFKNIKFFKKINTFLA